jgi:hypothetical protein
MIDQGLNYFMTHHAVGMDQPSISSQAYNRFLSTDGFHPLVSTTMTALGIAGVANLYMDPALKQEATRWYLNAIKMANAAISSPEEVRSDTTLVAINLLTMFEATHNDDNLAGWSNHVDGASLLVKLRGADGVRTAAGRRLYLHTVGLLTINCMGKGIPTPNYVKKINDEMIEHLDTTDPRTAFFFLHLKTADLRALVLSHKHPDLEDIINQALKLDATAASIFNNADPEWHYETVPCFGTVPGVYGHYYHVYPTHSTAQTWNWVRYNRIYFHDIIRCCILAGMATTPPTLVGAKYADQLGTSTSTLQQLQADIIASMPQFLHDTPMTPPRDPALAFAGSPQRAATPDSIASHPLTPPSPGRDPRRLFENFASETVDLPPSLLNRSTATSRIPLIRISGGYSSVWALYVAGSMPTASAASQEYILGCLERVEREFGIAQAGIFAKALRLKRTLRNSGEVMGALAPRYLPPEIGDEDFRVGAGIEEVE